MGRDAAGTGLASPVLGRAKRDFRGKGDAQRSSGARLPNTLNVNFVGRVGAEVLSMLPGVAASTGSVTLSPVLAAMGVPPGEGMGAVRFSLGRATTWEEGAVYGSDVRAAH